MKIGFLTLFMFFFSCVEVIETEVEIEEYSLSLYMNVDQENGFYKVKYPIGRPNYYTSVYVMSHPNIFIDWYSDDEYCLNWMYQTLCEPIIQYSTFTRTDGSGQQMIYLTEDFIDDTLSVIGCIGGEICEEVYFIIE